MKLIILLLTSFAAFGQFARPTYNPFYGMQRPVPNTYNYGMQNNYGMQHSYNPYGMQQLFQRPQFPNNTNHPLNFHRPNNFGFQNNFQRPPQQNNFQPQQPQPQPPNPQQPNPQPAIPPNVLRLHFNNGYLFGRPTWYDPKTNSMQPWVRRNLR